MADNSRPLSVKKLLNMRGVLALAGVLGPVVLVIGDLSAALSNPQYNLVRDSISSLALTSMGWLQTIGFLSIGLLVEIFVAGLLFNIRGVRGFRYSIFLLVLFGFGLLLSHGLIFVGLVGMGARKLHVGNLNAYVYWFLLGIVLLWAFATGVLAF